MPDTPRKLLVVDDEPVVAEFMARVLGMQGFTIDIATDGETARSFISANGYEATIIDMRLPKLNGRQLYEYIKVACPRLARHVVFTSGALLDGEMADFLAGEGLFFLNKPFGTEDLKAAVVKALRDPGSMV